MKPTRGESPYELSVQDSQLVCLHDGARHETGGMALLRFQRSAPVQAYQLDHPDRR